MVCMPIVEVHYVYENICFHNNPIFLLYEQIGLHMKALSNSTAFVEI